MGQRTWSAVHSQPSRRHSRTHPKDRSPTMPSNCSRRSAGSTAVRHFKVSFDPAHPVALTTSLYSYKVCARATPKTFSRMGFTTSAGTSPAHLHGFVIVSPLLPLVSAQGDGVLEDGRLGVASIGDSLQTSEHICAGRSDVDRLLHRRDGRKRV